MDVVVQSTRQCTVVRPASQPRAVHLLGIQGIVLTTRHIGQSTNIHIDIELVSYMTVRLGVVWRLLCIMLFNLIFTDVVVLDEHIRK